MGARPGVNVVKSGPTKAAPAKAAPAPAKATPAPAKPAVVAPKPTVTAAKPAAAPVIASPKNPAVFPTAVGGAMEGKVLAAPGNAQNKVVLDAWKASGGTTTNTYVDKYTNLAAKGETALQEAARTQAAGTIAIFDKVAAAAGKPAMVVTNITGKNTETAKAALVKAPEVKPAPVITKSVSSGQNVTAAQIVATPLTSVASILAAPTAAPTISQAKFGISDFFSTDPFKIVNPAILQTPEQKKQLEAIPSIVKDIQGYINDQAKIAAMPKQEKVGGWLPNIDLTPGFNLGISDGSLITGLQKSVKDLLALPGQTIAAEKKTAQAVSASTLLIGAAVAYMLLKKK